MPDTPNPESAPRQQRLPLAWDTPEDEPATELDKPSSTTRSRKAATAASRLRMEPTTPDPDDTTDEAEPSPLSATPPPPVLSRRPAEPSPARSSLMQGEVMEDRTSEEEDDHMQDADEDDVLDGESKPGLKIVKKAAILAPPKREGPMANPPAGIPLDSTSTMKRSELGVTGTARNRRTPALLAQQAADPDRLEASSPAETPTPAEEEQAYPVADKTPLPRPAIVVRPSVVARSAAPPEDDDEAPFNLEGTAAEGKPMVSLRPKPKAASKAAPAVSVGTAAPGAASAEGGPSATSMQLKAAREARDLTTQQVAEQTHIRPDYIELLEAESYDRMPVAAVYTRSYIKTLCRLYGLDPATYIASFEAHQGRSSDPAVAASAHVDPQKLFRPDPQAGTMNQTVGGESENHLKLAFIILGIILVLVLLGSLVKMLVLNRATITGTPAAIEEKDLQNQLPPENWPLRELPLPNSDATPATPTTSGAP